VGDKVNLFSKLTGYRGTVLLETVIILGSVGFLFLVFFTDLFLIFRTLFVFRELERDFKNFVNDTLGVFENQRAQNFLIDRLVDLTGLERCVSGSTACFEVNLPQVRQVDNGVQVVEAVVRIQQRPLLIARNEFRHRLVAFLPPLERRGRLNVNLSF